MGDSQDLDLDPAYDQAINPRRAGRSSTKPSSSAPVDAIFEEIDARPHTKPKVRPTRDLLTYQPFMRAVSQQQVEIMGYRDDKHTFPWGFWGGVGVIAVLFGLIFFKGSTGLFSMMDLLIALVLGGIAAVLLKWGPRDSVVAQVLTVLDVERKLISWPDAEGGQGAISLELDQIKEIVFAMIHFPVSPNRPDAQIQVFTLLVRDDRDQLLPIIEASPSKEETYDVAQALSRWSGLPISQVGEGILDA